MVALPEESIFIRGLTANQSLDIVKELKELGLIQGRDFEFRYQPRQDDGFTYNDTIPRGCEFYFNEGKWTSYMAIKYSST
jgi:hypothetical protein